MFSSTRRLRLVGVFLCYFWRGYSLDTVELFGAFGELLGALFEFFGLFGEEKHRFLQSFANFVEENKPIRGH